MKRLTFQHADLQFSYLDSGGELPVIIALHAHWMEGVTFAPLAELMTPERRIIALDQRGHGYSSHADTYTRADYLSDMDALFHHLDIKHAVLLGNSLGGVNAYRFAAQHPDLADALIIEDIGVEIAPDLPPMTGWDGIFATRAELENQVGVRMLPYLKDSFRETTVGWKLAFAPRDMAASQAAMAGNHWEEWLASDCPALVIRGSESRVTTQSHVEEMAAGRANTKTLTLSGGHVVHQDNLTAFAAAVKSFLATV